MHAAKVWYCNTLCSFLNVMLLDAFVKMLWDRSMLASMASQSFFFLSLFVFHALWLENLIYGHDSVFVSMCVSAGGGGGCIVINSGTCTHKYIKAHNKKCRLAKKPAVSSPCHTFAVMTYQPILTHQHPLFLLYIQDHFKNLIHWFLQSFPPRLTPAVKYSWTIKTTTCAIIYRCVCDLLHQRFFLHCAGVGSARLRPARSMTHITILPFGNVITFMILQHIGQWCSTERFFQPRPMWQLWHPLWLQK